jgi:hypothetical protein
MVLGQSDEKDGGLVDEVWVQLDVAEAGAGACRAESASDSSVTLVMVVASRPVISAAMAR